MTEVNMKGRDPLPPLYMKEKRMTNVQITWIAIVAIICICAAAMQIWGK